MHPGILEILRNTLYYSSLPADITSYKPPPCTLSFLAEDQVQMLVSSLQTSVDVELASALYARLDNLTAPLSQTVGCICLASHFP
jgi:hypothetical protein